MSLLLNKLEDLVSLKHPVILQMLKSNAHNRQ